MNLDDFSFIFQDSDFSTISHSQIQQELYQSIFLLNKQEFFDLKLFESFLFSLEEFSSKYCVSKHSELYLNLKQIIELLEHILEISSYDFEKRVQISSGSLSQKAKTFLYLLKEIKKSLVSSFLYENLKDFRYSIEILKRYIYDEKIGFKSQLSIYSGNNKDYFDEKILHLNKEELHGVIHKLEDLLTHRQKLRYIKHWYDLGEHKSPIRILAVKQSSLFSKQNYILVYLFKIHGEHNKYCYALDHVNPEAFLK